MNCLVFYAPGLSLNCYNSEFLVHAADIEGLCQGIDTELVTSEFFVPYKRFSY